MKDSDHELEKDILWKIHENLIRTEERLKAFTEQNKDEHAEIKGDIQKECDVRKKLQARIDELEHNKIKLSTTTAIILFLWGAIPTILALLALFHII